MQGSATPVAMSRPAKRTDAARTAFVAGAAVFVVIATLALLPLTGPLPLVSALAAGLLYLVSHLLRAFRLAILSVEMLGVSGRTTVLMHFATAPISLALPLKLGELTRLYELWRLSGTLVYSVVVLLVDRMYDSLFLVPLLAILLLQNDASPALIVLTCVAAFVPLAVIVVGPRLMTEVQRYVVAHHNDAGTLGTLRGIDAVRRVVTHAARVARQQAPTLVVLSLLIWLLEVLVCLILVSAIGCRGGKRLRSPWQPVDRDMVDRGLRPAGSGRDRVDADRDASAMAAGDRALLRPATGGDRGAGGRSETTGEGRVVNRGYHVIVDDREAPPAEVQRLSGGRFISATSCAAAAAISTNWWPPPSMPMTSPSCAPTRRPNSWRAGWRRPAARRCGSGCRQASHRSTLPGCASRSARCAMRSSP